MIVCPGQLNKLILAKNSGMLGGWTWQDWLVQEVVQEVAQEVAQEVGSLGGTGRVGGTHTLLEYLPRQTTSRISISTWWNSRNRALMFLVNLNISWWWSQWPFTFWFTLARIYSQLTRLTMWKFINGVMVTFQTVIPGILKSRFLMEYIHPLANWFWHIGVMRKSAFRTFDWLKCPICSDKLELSKAKAILTRLSELQ